MGYILFTSLYFLLSFFLWVVLLHHFYQSCIENEKNRLFFFYYFFKLPKKKKYKTTFVLTLLFERRIVVRALANPAQNNKFIRNSKNMALFFFNWTLTFMFSQFYFLFVSFFLALFTHCQLFEMKFEFPTWFALISSSQRHHW